MKGKSELQERLKLLQMIEAAAKDAQYLAFSNMEQPDKFTILGTIKSPVLTEMFAMPMSRAILVKKCNDIGIKPLIIEFEDFSKS